MKCNKCGKEGNKRCSKCKKVFYCSIKCQKDDWKDHKVICKMICKEPVSEDKLKLLEDEIIV